MAVSKFPSALPAESRTREDSRDNFSVEQLIQALRGELKTDRQASRPAVPGVSAKPTGTPYAARQVPPQSRRKIKTEIIRLFPDPPQSRKHRWQVGSVLALPLTALMVFSTGIPAAQEQGSFASQSLAVSVLPSFESPSPTVTPVPVVTPASVNTVRTWKQFSEEERAEFINEQFQRISAMLGESSHSLSDDAVWIINRLVNEYASRASSPRKTGSLNRLFDRAGQYAPVIVRSFQEQRVPVVIGLYLPMIESEYQSCVSSPYGAKGLFQFLPTSARLYGVQAHELCDIEHVAPAAAKYIADRISEFGTDARSMSLVLLSFNRSPDSVRRDLRMLRRENPDLERSFWTLFDHSHKLDKYFRRESRLFVPKFFAAAIVGENPETFGLSSPPLSSYGQ